MILFINRCTAEHATARQSLDMLMMAVSLDQASAALYTGFGIQQLLKPEPAQPADPMKKIAMLEDLFDFDAFYVINDELRERNLTESDFRVPIRIIDSTQAVKLESAAKHVLRF